MHVGCLSPIIAQDITAVQVAWIGALSAGQALTHLFSREVGAPR